MNFSFLISFIYSLFFSFIFSFFFIHFLIQLSIHFFILDYFCSAVVNVLDCYTIISNFLLQSHYYVHFPTNAHGERYELLITPNYRLNSTTTDILQYDFGIK